MDYCSASGVLFGNFDCGIEWWFGVGLSKSLWMWMFLFGRVKDFGRYSIFEGVEMD